MRIEGTSSSPVLAGIKWRECYSCYRTQIARWLELSFSYHSDTDGKGTSGYRVSIGTVRIKQVGRDPENAAKLAVAAARSLIAQALQELDQSSERRAGTLKSL